jgi:ATP-dependent Clp protease protease subunit
VAIYNTLKRHSAHVRVEIDGAAMSAASFIAMAGDEIAMAENAIFMIHDPWTVVMGNARDMRTMADSMDKVRDTITSVYHSRTMLPVNDINNWMAAETYFDADEAHAVGFATEIVPNKGVNDLDTSVIRNRWKDCPEQLVEKLEASAVNDTKLENMRRRVAVFSQFRG